MNWITDRIPEWNSWLAMVLYWLPLFLCLYGYAIEFGQKYRSEINQRAKSEADEKVHFFPELTVGWIVGHIFIIVVPVANLIAGIFDVAPKVFGDFFTWISKTLDIPLVRKRKP